MSLDKIEIWIHDHVLKNDMIRHFCYGAYQRALYLLSPKFKYEGNISVVTPDDGYEYLFGYYDKCPWSEDGQYLLALRVKNASCNADSTAPAEIIRIDLKNNNTCEILTTTHCWNVQQGCMAQWMDDNTILYNDFRNGKYCAVILNLHDRTERIIDRPVYTVSADKKTALSLDFSRLHRLRPGYGYANIADASKGQLCPEETCIWKIDLVSGEIVPLLTYRNFYVFESRPEMEGAEHKVNHLMISPDGSRFMVLHRWFKNKVKYTRLVTCNMDGSGMYNLSDDDFVSHCCWKNDNEILSYLNKNDGGKGYYLMRDKTHEYKRMWPELAMDGHPTYSYDGELVVTDTYPNRKRIQSVYIMKGNRVKCIAKVFSPFKYGGDVRCDLHPRWNKNGNQICFDASFGGKRSVCVVDVAKKQSDRNLYDEAGNTPKISIIIPCYNCADLLAETLQSLEDQTFKDFEVVAINDGSKDNTLAVLKEWQNKSTLNIIIVDQPNGGVSNARNHGICVANGEYLLFLDSDDIYHEEFVERMVYAVLETKADTVYCRLSRNLEEVRQYNAQGDGIIVHTPKKAMDKLLFEMGKYAFCCYLYKKTVLLEEGICFDENTKFGEDREFNWKYLCHCKKIVWVDMPLYGYRVNANSATQKSASWRKTDLLAAVKRIEEYLKKQNCSYSDTFNDYMYARAMWAVAKTFAVSGDKELFNRLRKEFDVRKCMKRTSKDNIKIVAIASVLYRIHPMLFYSVVRLKK